MQLLAVRTARVLAFFNAEELNPKGLAIAHDFLPTFVERYSFLAHPQKAEEILDYEDKGITFETGKWNGFQITKVVLFSWGVVVETPASTDVSEAMLQDVLDWGAESFGLSNRPDLIRRKGYVSELVFTSDMMLPTINPAINDLGKRVTESIAKNYHLTLPYEISSINLHFDTNLSRQFFAAFRIERFENTPHHEKKYYSGAPLPTAEHIKLLEDFEAALTS